VDLTVRVPIEEWTSARRLVTLLSTDERSLLSRVRLRADGRRRCWYASDSYRAARLGGGDDTRTYDLSIPRALLNFASSTAGDDSFVELRIAAAPDGRYLTAATSAGKLTVEVPDGGFPDIDGLQIQGDRIGAAALIEALALHNAIASSRIESGDADNPPEPIWLGIDDSGIVVDFPSEHTTPSRLRIDAERAHGDVWVRVNAGFLLDVIRLFDAGELLEIHLPRFVPAPLSILGGDHLALLMPIQTPLQQFVNSVEEVIKEEAGPLALRRDDDGDYPLRHRSTPIYGRLLADSEPPTLQVFAVLMRNIDASPELLTELNDLNTNSIYERVFHIDGQILAEVDLDARNLDVDQLRLAVRRIERVAGEIIPTLALVLGGDVVDDPAVARSVHYRSTVVEAELIPNSPTALNGTDGIDPWPFDGPVYALTGWNPHGTDIGADAANDVNRQIAQDIHELGGRFTHGAGRAIDNSHSEPTIIAWGISCDDALDIGRRAAQDAIFEITADEISVLDCHTGGRLTSPRLA